MDKRDVVQSWFLHWHEQPLTDLCLLFSERSYSCSRTQALCIFVCGFSSLFCHFFVLDCIQSVYSPLSLGCPLSKLFLLSVFFLSLSFCMCVSPFFYMCCSLLVTFFFWGNVSFCPCALHAHTHNYNYYFLVLSPFLIGSHLLIVSQSIQHLANCQHSASSQLSIDHNHL